MNRIALMILKNLTKFPAAFIKLCHYAKHTEKYSWQEKWDHIHYMMGLAVKGGNVDLQVTGIENLPKDRAFMLYGNHQGMFDIVALAATCPTPLGAVMKKELVGKPLLQQIMDCTHSYPMDREDIRQSLTVIQNVIEEVKKGRGFIIFPEGTRSKTGNTMGEFHGGSFRPVVKTKCPIVPIAFINSFAVLDQKGSAPLKVHIHYLNPIMPEEYEGMKATEIAAMVKERIQACIDENLPKL